MEDRLKADPGTQEITETVGISFGGTRATVDVEHEGRLQDIVYVCRSEHDGYADREGSVFAEVKTQVWDKGECSEALSNAGGLSANGESGTEHYLLRRSA